MKSAMKSLQTTFWTLLLVTALSTVAAAEWGGHNGTIHLSFSDTSQVSVLNGLEPIPNLGLIVDVYAILTDLGPVLWHGEEVLTVGGIEMKLAVQGAQAEVLTRQFPAPAINMMEDLSHCITGYTQYLSLISGSAELVHWQVRITDATENISFHLDPRGAYSCLQMDDCRQSGTQAIWVSAQGLSVMTPIFSAGYVPAYLNWTRGEPDLTPVRGTTDWNETGLFTSD